MLDNGLALIGDVRDSAERTWLGFQEPWIVDFFPAMARAYPDARFLVLLPRSSGRRRLDEGDRAHRSRAGGEHGVVRAPLAKVRRAPGPPPERSVHRVAVRTVGYERLLREPEQLTREIAAFLDLQHDPRMTHAEAFVDWGTGKTWSGNSSFGTEAGTIDATAADRWRHTLDPDVQRLVEWLCGPDMRVAGYEPETDDQASALRTLAYESGQYSHWRSDEGDVLIDAGAELLRRSLLRDPGAVDDDIAGRCFLFPELRARLVDPGTPLLVPTVGTAR